MSTLRPCERTLRPSMCAFSAGFIGDCEHLRTNRYTQKTSADVDKGAAGNARRFQGGEDGNPQSLIQVQAMILRRTLPSSISKPPKAQSEAQNGLVQFLTDFEASWQPIVGASWTPAE